MLLQWMSLLMMVMYLEAQEVRIPAYGTRTKPILRIIPSDTTVIRVRKPDQPKPGSTPLRESTITRIQPVLLAPKVTYRVSLVDALIQMRLRSMASLVSRAKLQNILTQAGPITLFAPTDEAFSLMTPPSDPGRLRDFVLQHVVKGRITPQDVRNDVTLPSLRSGERPLRLNVYEDGQMLSVSGSQFLDDPKDAGNVRIQPIDRVLYPISNEDLVTEVRLTFPRLYEFLLNSSLTSQLTSGTFTLFAPTDAAFEALTPEVRQQLFHNPTLLRKVLLNHVVPGTHFSAVLAHGYSLRSLGGEPVYFTNRRGLILGNGIPIVKSDISVTNGVIHAVNRLLLPPELHTRRKPVTVAPPLRRTTVVPPRHDLYAPVQTYVEPAPAIPRTLTKTMSTPLQLPDGEKATFSTANSLFRRSLLLSTLRNNATGEGFTILMPTDDAFTALGSESIDRMRRNTRLLRRMLLLQMIEGKVNFTDMDDKKDRPVRSLGGTIIISSVDGGKSLMAGGARILSVRPATNGIVLVTDRVSFPPPPKNVAEALTPLITFKKVVDRQPDIKASLTSGDTAYTVFAPTDTALSALPPEQLQDPKFLNDLFWAHVVSGAYYRNRLAPGLQLTTMRGNIITVQRTRSGDVLVNNLPLSGEEILAGNGVIHKIDHILFVPGQVHRPKPAADVPTFEALEPEDELEKIARTFNATQFLGWMEKAQMRNILQNQASRTGGCTLFLPTNSALDSMSPTLRSITIGDIKRLQKFIRFHISPMTLSWNSVRDNAVMPSLLPGKQIRCNIYANGRKPGILSASGCRVSAMRPLGPDGNITVAVIEGTMAPAAGNMMLTVAKSPLLSNFSKILKVAGADEFFADGSPYTLFAPNSCVFQKMDPDEYHRLITNKKSAREFVKRYMVRGCYYASGLYDGQILITEAGTELTVKVTPDCIIISGVEVLHGDMSSTDGVLHVIAKQLPT